MSEIEIHKLIYFYQGKRCYIKKRFMRLFGAFNNNPHLQITI